MVTARNSLDKLTAGVSTRANLLTYFNSNLDIIDAAIAKCNFVAAADPTADDDSADGYAAGSQWHNTTDHKIFLCEDATEGAAVWRLIYPGTGDMSGPAGATNGNIPLFDGATGKLVKNSTYSPASFAEAAKGVTGGDSHAHTGGAGAAIVAAAISFSATARVLGRKTAAAGAGEECTITEILDLLGTAERGDILYRGDSGWAFLPHGTAGQVLQSGGHGADPSWEDTATGGGAAFWADMPAEVTRVSDTSFSMPDASNANYYNLMFDPGTIIRWEKSGGGNQFAVITAASYSSNVVTYTILGNTLSAGFSEVKYCIHKAMQEINIMPGTNPRAAETGVGKTILLPYDIYVFGARIRYGTAPTTTKGVWDINDDGASIFTTKPEIAASATMGSWQVANCLLATALTAVVADSLITTDYDSGHATTPGADAYVRILFMPVAWRYRT